MRRWIARITQQVGNAGARDNARRELETTQATLAQVDTVVARLSAQSGARAPKRGRGRRRPSTAA